MVCTCVVMGWVGGGGGRSERLSGRSGVWRKGSQGKHCERVDVQWPHTGSADGCI
jgi:hypothetical protein